MIRVYMASSPAEVYMRELRRAYRQVQSIGKHGAYPQHVLSDFAGGVHGEHCPGSMEIRTAG
jgi:hypothetical protein